jgi:hypothetical protein
MSKQVGRMSQSSNDFLAPYAPTIGTATDVGTDRPYNNGAATVTFTPTGPNAATSYTVTSSPGGYTATGASSPITVTGLQSGTAYTFKVKGTNAAGTGEESSASNSITATTVPQAPTVSAVDVGTNRPYNNGAATVTVTANATGGKAITSYGATPSGLSETTSGSSPVTPTGMLSATGYTFTGRVYNANGWSAASAATASVTITTVPATPGAPSASSPSAGNDSVSWSAPANGGKAITNYYWTSSDGKSGNTTGTSVTVSQEQGTAQTYNVRADNANGSSNTSANSASVTTTFSFAPFGAFGFTPFGFTPFGFTPFGAFGAFGFTPFGAFGAFGFTPFGAFGAFGFTPFGAFGAFGFTPAGHHSLAESTQVLVPGAPGSTKTANQLVVGDTLLALNIPNPDNIDWTEWQVESSSLSLSDDNIVETQIVSINNTAETQFIYVNGDLFSKSHYILVQKGAVTKFIKASDIDTSYKIFSSESKSFVDVVLVDTVDITLNKISINCEPYDNFFTATMLVFDRPDPIQ